MKPWVIPCGKLIVAAGLIYWLIDSGGLPLSGLARLGEGWPWFLAAQAPYAAVLLLAAFRWSLLLRVQGISYRFVEIYSLVLMGIFFNQVLFGSTGGDVMKAYYVARDSTERRAAAALTVFIDRAIGLFALMSLACAATLFNFPLLEKEGDLWNLAVFVWVGVGASILIAGIFYLWRGGGESQKEGGVIRKITEILSLYKSHPAVVIQSLCISILLHSLVVITNLFLIRALAPDMDLSLWTLFLVIPLAQIVMAIPLTPGAIGTAEVAYNWLFQKVGIGVKGGLVSILQRLTYCFWSVPGLIIYLRNRKRAPDHNHAELSPASETAPQNGPPD